MAHTTGAGVHGQDPTPHIAAKRQFRAIDGRTTRADWLLFQRPARASNQAWQALEAVLPGANYKREHALTPLAHQS